MIEDRDRLARTAARRIALDCVEAGIEAALPQRVIESAVRVDGHRLSVRPVSEEEHTTDLDDFSEILVLGGGKAAAGVAAALEDVLGPRLSGGFVVTDTPEPTRTVAVEEGDHPIPSERNVRATARLLERARAASAETLVVFVLTGGASALLSAPADGIGLDDLQATTAGLLDSGASIHEINAVRKHLSAIKGGRLAAASEPATLLTLAISDVVGDDLSVIGSGPSVPDPSTYGDALAVLDRYEVAVAPPVRDRLKAGHAGDLPETPKLGDPAFERSAASVIANNLTALEAATGPVPDAYSVCILSSRFQGEARGLADPHVAIAAEVAASGTPVEPPAVLLSGGEGTVTVRGEGEGGPNQEFVVATALGLDDVPGVDPTRDQSGFREVVVAAVDSDGRDGATDAAGGLLDGTTIGEDDAVSAHAALSENDTMPYLAEHNGLIVTGRTGTNVNDLRVLVVREALH